MKAEYQRLVKEEEEAKKKAETTIGVVTTAGNLGVQSTITDPAVAAATAEIARLKQELKEPQTAKTVPDSFAAADLARLRKKLNEMQIAN